jgi:ADP-ribosylglycohydrolase
VSIFQETQPERQAGHDPIRLFTNRYEASRDFAARINDDPPRRAVVFYTGLGGNGKTALLRHFQDRCCFRVEDRGQWREIVSYPDELFASSLGQAPSARPVPVSYLDFGARPSGLNRPQEAFSALFMVKRQLARHRVDTHRFDLAAIAYLRKTGLDPGELLRELFPGGQLGLAADLADALLNLPVVRTGSAIFDLVNRRLDDAFGRWRLQRRVPPQVANEILALPAEPDLADALPRYFAADLADALQPSGEHARIVLLFDTYEAFDGEAVAERRTYLTDLAGARWFRSLLGHLPLDRGVVAIVAGRTEPRWSQAVHERIPDRFVDLRSIGPLDARFADRYLAEAGVADPVLRRTLIRHASIAPGAVHPLLLGICADLVLGAQRQGEPVAAASFPATPGLADRERELIARLLAWVDPVLEEAIVALSASRSFDQRTFNHLVRELRLEVRPGDFRRLVGFSFVTSLSRAADPEGAGPAGTPELGGRPGEEPEPVYEIHRLLRRGVAQAEPAAVRAAHGTLAAYYAGMAAAGDFTSRLEEIYHRGQLDPAAGVGLWRTAMEQALKIGRYDRCRSLVALLSELEVPAEVDRHSVVYLLGRAELGLGRWQDAEALLAGLPADSPYGLLLQADLAFVRGDFDLAEQHAAAAQASATSPVARLAVLFRAAELRLFRGQFQAGVALCQEGSRLAGSVGDANDLARWRNLHGEIEFFRGEPERATAAFADANQALETLPEPLRNQELRASLRQNAALVHSASGRAAAAVLAMREALQIRREIGDSRGIAHGLHGLGVVTSQAGDHTGAAQLFADAEAAARDLGEGLLLTKLKRARAELALRAGDLPEAEQLASDAVGEFERREIPYDVAHALLTLAQVHERGGDATGQLAAIDRARGIIEAGDHASLYQRYPGSAPPPADRIAQAMLAFAAGDALGVPWEGRPAAEIDPERVAELPARAGWPRGATSDDTAQLWLVASTLADTEPDDVPLTFLDRLARALPDMRGTGPSTRAAVEHFRRTGQPPAEPARSGATNGAAMRVAPVGWMTPVSRVDERRALAIRLSVVTHPAPVSIGAACVVAAMAAWSVEEVGAGAIVQAALAESEWFSGHRPEAAGSLRIVAEAAEGRWRPGPDGVSLDAAETVAAVVHVLRTHDRLAAALPYAVGLGGDTDTVAALVGGVLGGREAGAVASLPWLGRIRLAGRDRLPGLAARLCELRRRGYTG